jgi:hypothetical protein
MEFIKMVRSEQDRLQETSPSIPESVIHHFKRHFKDNTTVEKPEIIGDLDHVTINKSTKNEDYPTKMAQNGSMFVGSTAREHVAVYVGSPTHDHYSQSTQAAQE